MPRLSSPGSCFSSRSIAWIQRHWREEVLNQGAPRRTEPWQAHTHWRTPPNARETNSSGMVSFFSIALAESLLHMLRIQFAIHLHKSIEGKLEILTFTSALHLHLYAAAVDVARTARRSSTAARSSQGAHHSPLARPYSACAHTGSTSIVESRRRLLQRCFIRRLGLGARALAVVSRDDEVTVCKPIEGVFYKNGNTQTRE
jgi:hypothetical protein